MREALFDDGTHGDKIANDGIFSFLVDLQEVGEYRLQIVAQAPTFERRQQLAFRVKPRIVTLSVGGSEHAGKAAAAEGHAAPASEGEHGDHSAPSGHGEKGAAPAETKAQTGDSFLVELSPEVAGLKDAEVKIVAIDKNNKRFAFSAASAGDALTYRASVAALPHDGSYEVQAFLSGETKKKSRVKEDSNIISFEKVTAGEQSEEVHVVVEPKKEEEEAPSPILPILLLTLLNAAAGFAGHLMLKKAQSEVSFKVPEFESVTDVEAAIQQLEAAAAQTEIDLNDPRLNAESAGSLKFYKGGSPGPSVGAAPAQPAEPVSDGKPAPEEVPAAPAAPAEEAAEAASSEGEAASEESSEEAKQ